MIQDLKDQMSQRSVQTSVVTIIRQEQFIGRNSQRLDQAVDGVEGRNFLSPLEGGNGAHPSAGLVFDASGNLYGTTQYGGDQSVDNGISPNGAGPVFEVDVGK